MALWSRKPEMPTAETALAGRETSMPVPEQHEILATPLKPPFPGGLQRLVVGMGCFWGAERIFWQIPGVYSTAVGYTAGITPNPTYEETCSGLTGHNEAVLVVFDPTKVSYETLLKAFWEGHNPTQGMRQGNDMGTQYRSGIYVDGPEQLAAAEASRDCFQAVLDAAGMDRITTEILDADTWYYAEHYHQQYLHKVPNGYCGLGGTGLSCPVGVATAD
ncbi:MAG: peptide-methionine (S)-S-oxide reductase [Candidatus Poriferisodalaceae bacterium]|jgi:peptide-methionine (S)-S-oxide reductase